MKILTVEDDHFFQKFYAEKLREQGFTVDVASDGEEGLQKAREFHPDLILLDIIMPKKDGFDVLTDISQDPQLKSIPVLVFSTLGLENDVQKALQLGARGFVNKSLLDFNALLTKIQEITKH